MIKAGTGSSEKTEHPQEAGVEAAKQAADKLGGAPDFLLVLSSIALKHPEVISGIHSAYPDVPLIGASTAGEITAEGAKTESVVVMAMKSDQMHFTAGKGGVVKDDPRKAGRMLAEDIKSRAKEEVTAMIVFTDVLGGNGTEVHRGILDVYGSDFTVIGSAAADDLNFKQTFEYYNGEVLSGYTVGVGLSGKYTKAFGAKHGWEKVGASRKVTKAKGTTVIEIDGKPAFELYKEYLGEKADDLKQGILTQIGLTYPMGMSVEGIEGFMIRTPLILNPDGSIVCGAEVIEGSTVNIMLGTLQNAVGAAEQVAHNVMSEFHSSRPSAVFISDCIARKKLYGASSNKEIDSVTAIIGKDVPIIGFYSYGQHAPVFGAEKNIDSFDPGFYEESIVLFAIGE